jgi:hypothetical protein
MAQRSDVIRQEVEETRSALDDKLNALERKANEVVDLRYQIEQHPLLAFGAAMTAGYALGRLEGEQGGRRGEHALAHFDQEISILKAAATSTMVAFFRDSIREYIPSLGRELDQVSRERPQN